MARKRKGRAVNGIVLLDKPLGGSSNQLLQKVRWLFQAQKAGHTGALDPLATGMLPICLGEATKFSQFLLDADKEYEVTAKLGIRTTTSDADGEIVEERPVTVSEAEVRAACESFIGSSKQIPSMFSALKYQGKPLYTYARQGIEVLREARDITIFALIINRIALPEVDMTVHCSKGTYIRSLVDDIGQQLGCGAYVTRLHRTKVADYPNDKMVPIEVMAAMVSEDIATREFTQIDELLLPMDTAVKSLPTLYIDEEQTHRLQHGQSVSGQTESPLVAGQYYRIYGILHAEEAFMGVGEAVLNPKDQKVESDTLFVSPRRSVVYDEA
ncbi:tRNA pseudouridine(55) synthase TruB [Aestuariibacter sp. GS-14]|uniref:tRNA pseudouridine(55) synthase TruB n=1 Tax=Aestuariibacter sp. GS-14 TaxID=2590670 RepID=UPI00112E80FC|nr:tRNA pseudouridine(55) synthase TruB [Aestuariibacter sp. GS-14]TPV60911.1 tRNA pseudouridine(55) synthase TruB [Aestuariibacter sp. GS-14]